MANNTKQICRSLCILLVLLPLLSIQAAGAAVGTTANSNSSATTHHVGGQCDGTKCRAPLPFFEDLDLFRGYCWYWSEYDVDPEDWQRLCADGYEAQHTVDKTIRQPDFLWDAFEDYTEFTCCPQGHNDSGVSPAITRNCDSSVCASRYHNKGYTYCQVQTGFGLLEPGDRSQLRRCFACIPYGGTIRSLVLDTLSLHVQPP